MTPILRQLVMVAAMAYILTFVILASLRAQYPFELEWMEGGIIDHVARVVADEDLYVEPSLDFTPYIYPPLYFYVTAAFAELTGVGFAPARFISTICTLVVMVFIFLFVYNKTRDRYWALLAVGLFAATYRISGAWFDTARIDSMYLALVLASAYVTLKGESRGAAILAGILISLAFLTKQNALVVAAAFTVFYLIYSRHSAWFILTIALGIGGTTLHMNLKTHGWYFFYLFDLPANHPIYYFRYLTFWTKDLLPHVPVAMVAAGVWLFRGVKGLPRREIFFWWIIAVSLLGSSLLGRIHPGGYDNVLIPAYAILSILFGLGGKTVLEKLTTGRSRTRSLGPALAYIVCLVQFGILFYNPAAQVPTRADRDAGMRLLEKIDAFPGEVLTPFHGRLAVIDNRPIHAQQMAITDVFKGAQKDQRKRLDASLREAVESQRFDAIIIDRPWYDRVVKDYYEESGTVFEQDSVFYPVTGYRIRPETILVPRK